MKKAIIQGAVLFILFFSTWFTLSQIDWMSIFKVNTISKKAEKKLGDLFWEMIKQSEKENKDSFVVSSVDSLIQKICTRNKLDRSLLKIHIVEQDEINAFALPNGHLVIYSGLILAAENQEALSGVICHELAHIQLNHVMKKLVKEIGLNLIISITAGNAGGGTVREASKALTSSAFDRSLEKDADIKAIDYLKHAAINPKPFADFLYYLSTKENAAQKYLTWISTHPDSKERADYLNQIITKTHAIYQPILEKTTWDKLLDVLSQSNQSGID